MGDVRLLDALIKGIKVSHTLMVRFFSFFLPFLLCGVVVGCDVDSAIVSDDYGISNLGGISYSAKSLGGVFFSEDCDIFLFAGTESNEGANAQVFLYDVNKSKVVFENSIISSKCVLAFCRVGGEIYFGTISGSANCELYSFNITTKELELRQRFAGKGIYTMAFDGDSLLYIATSQDPRLFSYNIKSGISYCLLSDFTEGAYIRSMTYYKHHCYLGIGANADLIDYDVLTKNYHSILPMCIDSTDNTFAIIYTDGNWNPY